MHSQKRPGAGPSKIPGSKGAKAAVPGKKAEPKAPILDDADIDKLIIQFLNTQEKRAWTTADLGKLNRQDLASVLESLTENVPVAGLQAALSLSRGGRTPLDRFNSLYNSKKVPKGQKKVEMSINTSSATMRKALVELMPENLADLATIGTMLYPQENKDLTRKLLRYFGAFSLAYGGGWKDITLTSFHQALDEVLSGREADELAMAKLQDLIEEINQKICQADELEQNVEVLKREHQEKTDLIFQLRQQLSSEEEAMSTERRELQEKERDLQRMRNKIDAVNSNLDKAKEQIVSDLGEIRHNLANGEAKKIALTMEKEKIEGETADLELKREKLSNLSERIGKFSMWLTEIVEKMHKLSNLDTEHEFMKDELNSLKQEKQLLEQDLAKVTREESKEQQRANLLRQEAEARIMNIELEISSLQDKIALLKDEIETRKREIEQYEVAIAENIETSDEYWNEFVENFEHLKNGIPHELNLYKLALRRIAQAHIANVSRMQPPKPPQRG